MWPPVLRSEWENEDNFNYKLSNAPRQFMMVGSIPFFVVGLAIAAFRLDPETWYSMIALVATGLIGLLWATCAAYKSITLVPKIQAEWSNRKFSDRGKM